MKERLRIYICSFNLTGFSRICSAFQFSALYISLIHHTKILAGLNFDEIHKGKHRAKKDISINEQSFFKFKLVFAVLIFLINTKSEAASYAVTAISISATQTGSVIYGTGGN